MAQRGWIWTFAALLVLQTALPWLADLAAARQGRTSAEICSVHGYGAVPLTALAASDTDQPGSGDRRDDGALQATAACPLATFATLAFGPGALPGVPMALVSPGPTSIGAERDWSLADAAAAWHARRSHAPPSVPRG